MRFNTRKSILFAICFLYCWHILYAFAYILWGTGKFQDLLLKAIHMLVIIVIFVTSVSPQKRTVLICAYRSFPFAYGMCLVPTCHAYKYMVRINLYNAFILHSFSQNNMRLSAYMLCSRGDRWAAWTTTPHIN